MPYISLEKSCYKLKPLVILAACNLKVLWYKIIHTGSILYLNYWSVVSMLCVNVGVHGVHTCCFISVFFYCCVTHHDVVILRKVSDQSCRIWGSGRSLYSVKSLSPCVAIWARFLIVVHGNSLHLALVCWLWQNTWPQWKKTSVTYERNSDH